MTQHFLGQKCNLNISVHASCNNRKHDPLSLTFSPPPYPHHLHQIPPFSLKHPEHDISFIFNGHKAIAIFENGQIPYGLVPLRHKKHPLPNFWHFATLHWGCYGKAMHASGGKAALRLLAFHVWWGGCNDNNKISALQIMLLEALFVNATENPLDILSAVLCYARGFTWEFRTARGWDWLHICNLFYIPPPHTPCRIPPFSFRPPPYLSSPRCFMYCLFSLSVFAEWKDICVIAQGIIFLQKR